MEVTPGMTSRTKTLRGRVMPTEPPQEWVISTAFRLGINLGDLPADMAGNIAWRIGRIGLAPAEQQPVVSRLAEITHHEAGIGDRFLAGDDIRIGVERCGGADEGADRHDVGGRYRFQIANIGIGGDQYPRRGDRAEGRLDDGLAARLPDGLGGVIS